jgi:hypothetical protein
MELLLIIGVTLFVATILCCVVEEMAVRRGRNRAAWTIAAFIGLLFAFIGWIVVAVALVALGPSAQTRMAHGHGVASVH